MNVKNDKKKNIIKIVSLALIVIIICAICFFASLSKEEKYSSSSSENLSSEGTDVLETATKEAGEISDDERVEAKSITIDDYLGLYSASENSIVLLSRPSCQYCKIAMPILENIIYKYNVEINYVNLDSITDDDKTSLFNSNSYFSDGISTPLLLVVGKNTITDKVEGLITSESYQAFFKEYGFME